MINQLHIAAQYLAAAGISFLEKREDDSHSNLEWSVQNSELITWPLSGKGDHLALNYSNFSLVWIHEETRKELFLSDQSHESVLRWINEMVQENNLDNYHYDFHYELPYPFPNGEYKLKSIIQQELNDFIKLMNVAQASLEGLLQQYNFKSDIRVWPHHFDLGAFVQVNESLSIGLGLAIPDEAIDDFYFYVSGYNGHDAIETKGFSPLSEGEWQTGSWKAASLRASNATRETVSNFLNEAVNTFLTNK